MDSVAQDSPIKEPMESFARRWDVRFYICLVAAVISLVLMPSNQYVGDPLAVRLTSWSILNLGTLSVPEQLAKPVGQPGQYFFVNPRNGHYYCKYGILNSLVYLPCLALERGLYGRQAPFNLGRERTILLNIHNLILTLLLVLLLYELVLLYTDRLVVALLWLVGTLYASFGWNYLRAQTSELLQWTLATGLFLALIKLYRSRGRLFYLALAHLFFLLLVLTKPVYALLGAAILATAWAAGEEAQADSRRWRYRLAVTLPLALQAGIVLFLNYWCFGSMWATGYTQWVRERHFFSGSIVEGVLGFCFDPQKSIFIYQPLLLPSLILLLALLFFSLTARWTAGLEDSGNRYQLKESLTFTAWRGWKFEMALAWGSLLLLLAFNSMTINWGGHWSYGPRYLLALLAPATLPAVAGLNYLAQRLSEGSWIGKAGMACTVLLLSIGLWMQWQVNSMGFFTYYYVEGCVERQNATQALAQLKKTPFPFLYYQLKRQQITKEYPPYMKLAMQETDPGGFWQIQQDTGRFLKRNYMFFP